MKRLITTSDMVSLATQKAETEFLRQSERKGIDQLFDTGERVLVLYERVTGEKIESDRDKLADLVSMHESEIY